MAASDKPFREQRTLDIVFAVSNILMLLSVVWMMYEDHFREYKVEQRQFREVEVNIAQRQALENIPKKTEFDAAEALVIETRKTRDSDENRKTVAEAQAKLQHLRPQREKADAAMQSVKADVDSITSFLSIALEHNETEAAERYRKHLKELNDNLVIKNAARDKLVDEMKAEQIKVDGIESPYTKASAAFKKVNDKFDTQVKLAIKKRWGFGDWLRTQPVIDGFASPLKIHQFTINDIPIDYNFKYVTRFDRCMTCHLGIDRPAYTRENLEALTKEDSHKKKLDEAIDMYKSRIASLDPADVKLVPNPNTLTLTPLSESVLTKARIREYAAHPRLDLFVGSDSKHPAERFGCSSCHQGQGSGTSFIDASHSPNDFKTREAWTADRHWEANHMWDFPMLPTRFVESSCIRCHHEITDMISTDNRIEAPKVVRGYNLIKENGCFGCHEISGWKSGNRIGPDLRLEPNPPLDDLNPIERTRVVNDTDNRPGNLRKVGPALTRVSEKVQMAWIEKWLSSPSAFRPDTKMPHYFGLSTNSMEALKATGSGQEKFPNTEIASIAHFLTKTSKDYLAKATAQHEADAKNAGAALADQNLLVDLLNKGRLDAVDQTELANVKSRIRLRKEGKLVDQAPGYKGNKKTGETLFIERGCLACHSHQGTENQNVMSDATFGPSLAQIPAKLGASEAARTWLIQWILNPQFHSPRSRMPHTHLTPTEAADVAAWLLDQKAEGLGEAWETINVPEPTKDELQNLARVYLTRMISKADIERYLKGELKDVEWEIAQNELTQDERNLYPKVQDTDALKYYLGKKAVNRLGCYGCHDIPGFESAKSIGVGLNDWGKKAADRLAFEDIGNFFKNHYYPVESLVDKDGKPVHGIKDKKQPYEQFYAEALLGHNHDRMGYLNQKIRDPRSYDFNRIRAWDDRARMPEFHFARSRKHKDESDADFQKRQFKEEADAREAVASFVLGLVAEQVPSKSINHPAGDRLAEVKGRQILDKYNCNGCHTIRPGVFDFKPGPKTLAKLEFAYTNQADLMSKGGEIVMANHVNWVGRNAPSNERLTSYAVQPTYLKQETDDGVEQWLILNPSEALRFKNSKQEVQNIPASTRFFVAAEDLPGGAAAFKSQADVDRYFSTSLPYGGAFANLLVPYLSKKDPKRYPTSSGDSAEARASLPPPLIGEGERTQADWLVKFLLNPQKVRKLSVLRMPKFNMSLEEAETLSHYFAAVTRNTNPGIGLTFPHATIPQQEDVDGPYWRKKTADYIAHLKKAKAMDIEGKVINGKDGKPMTAYQQRVAEYKPFWQQLSKQQEAALKADLKKLGEVNEAQKKQVEDLEKKIKTDKTKEADLQKEIDALKSAIADFPEQKAKMEGDLNRLDVKSLQEAWEEKEAYAADAYRLLTSRKLCVQCHQVGNITASEKDKQGPPLALAHERLRPMWVEAWVNKPQRFVPYASLMPPYFSNKELKWQPIHAGVAREQIDALRDVLMNFPRIADMPINRHYNPDLPADRK